jgi:hypothetical protein
MIFSVEFSSKTLVLKNIIILVAFMVLISVHSGFSQCNNPSQYPADLVIVVSDATTVIANNQFASEYNVTTGYLGGEVCEYTSSVPTDYITLRRADTNELIAHGLTPLFINYDIEYGDVEMHINSSSSCSISFLDRVTKVTLTTVSPCTALPNALNYDLFVNPGLNQIGIQSFDTYSNIKGFFPFDTITFDIEGSSAGSYFCTIRDTNGIAKFHGTNPLKFINYNDLKALQLHVNENFNCDELLTPVITTVKIQRAFCNHSNRKSPAQPIDIHEGLNILNYYQPSGTHNVSQGYQPYSKCTFTDASGRFIVLRSSVNDSLLAHGFGAVNLTYTPDMGKIETHINQDGECRSDNVNIFDKISVLVTLPCIGLPTTKPPIALNCGSKIETVISNNESVIFTGMVANKFILINAPYGDPNYYVNVRKASNDSLIYSGPEFRMKYKIFWGNLKVSISFATDCSFDLNLVLCTSMCICDNKILNPQATLSVVAGNNLIPNIKSGEFNLSEGYPDKSIVTFTSSNPNDYFTITSDFFSLHGKSPISFTYDKSKMGIIECNINKDQQCSSDGVSRLITLNVKPPCINNDEYPLTNTPITCNMNTIIATNQWPGDYNVTEGYSNGSFCTYTSSIATDYITLKGGSTTDSVIAVGKSPLSIVYSNAYGPEIYMHLSKDSLCNVESVDRTTSVSTSCNCFVDPIDNVELCRLRDSFNYQSPFSFHGLVNNAITISSKPGHTITVWNVSNKSIVATGLGSVSFSYIANTTLGVSVTTGQCENVDPFTIIKMIRSVSCSDADGDGVYDISDNCVNTSNAQQQDEDFDGTGDACETDFLSTNNIGIGTNNPMTKLQVKNGSIYLEDKDAGVLMKAANGTCWMVKMGNTGVVKTNQVDCPKNN